MSSTFEISPVYLASRGDSAGFLNRRCRFTRALGEIASHESHFLSADANPHRSLSAFRGISFLHPSPFGTRPLKDFRGVTKPVFDSFSNPNVFVRHNFPDNYYQIEPQRLEFQQDDPYKTEDINYGEIEDWIYLKQHPEISELLAENSDLRARYNQQKWDSDYELNAQIAAFARQRLEDSTYLNDLYLQDNPEEAKLIALNIGESANVLNQNPELRSGLIDEVEESYSQDIHDEIASKVASQLDKETELDADFFRQHPEAAFYLEKRPGLIERFNQIPQEAQNFKRFYHAVNEPVEEDIEKFARNSLSGLGLFTEQYLEQNPQFAQDVAIDQSLKSGNSLANSTISDNSLKDKDTSLGQIYIAHLARQAGEALGEAYPLNRNFFLQHPQLSYVVQKSSTLAQCLKEASAEIARFFPVPSGKYAQPLNVKGAIAAFTAGFPLRESNILDLWS